MLFLVPSLFFNLERRTSNIEPCLVLPLCLTPYTLHRVILPLISNQPIGRHGDREEGHAEDLEGAREADQEGDRQQHRHV